MYINLMLVSELPLLTGQKVGKAGRFFPTFIQEAPPPP